MTHKDLSVVIPVFNEALVLNELVTRLIKACDSLNIDYELILVDDGSSDDSRKILENKAREKDSPLKAVFLNRNYGQHSAIMAGFEQCIGNIVITLDADLQNPPEEIPQLYNKILEGYDVVGTVRIPRQDSMFRKIASKIVNAVARKSSGVMMTDYGCMLRAYKLNIIKAMLSCHERSTFIPILANMFARKTTEIEVSHNHRPTGNSKYDLWKLINLQFDLLTTTTSLPLRLLTILGGFVSLGSLIFGIFLLIMRVVYGSTWAAEGIFTLFALLFLLVGAQFMAMGLLGEYISRIYNDVRARPRYFIEKIISDQKKEG